jgi:hypothetical protein
MADLVSRVEVFLAAKGLQKLDTFSQSDPFAVLYSVAPNGQVLFNRRDREEWVGGACHAVLLTTTNALCLTNETAAHGTGAN